MQLFIEYSIFKSPDDYYDFEMNTPIICIPVLKHLLECAFFY